MCGIFGFIGNNIPVHQKMLLALLNQERGEDGVGLFNGDRRVRLSDAVSKALKHGKLDSDDFNHPFLLGHVRNATPAMGKGSWCTVANTHPFAINKVVGAHNGVWHNWTSVQAEFEKKNRSVKQCDLDSELAVWLIAYQGRQALSMLSGVGAMWWVDKNENPNKVYLWTWKKELAIGHNEDRTVVVFSSQLDHLRAAGFELHTQMSLETEGQLLAFTFDGERCSFERFDDLKAKETSVTTTTRAVSRWSDDHYQEQESWWDDWQERRQREVNQRDKATDKPKTESKVVNGFKKDAEEVDDFESVFNLDNIVIGDENKAYFCCECEKYLLPLAYDEHNRPLYLADTQGNVMCPDCNRLAIYTMQNICTD